MDLIDYYLGTIFLNANMNPIDIVIKHNIVIPYPIPITYSLAVSYGDMAHNLNYKLAN